MPRRGPFHWAHLCSAMAGNWRISTLGRESNIDILIFAATRAVDPNSCRRLGASFDLRTRGQDSDLPQNLREVTRNHRMNRPGLPQADSDLASDLMRDCRPAKGVADFDLPSAVGARRGHERTRPPYPLLTLNRPSCGRHMQMEIVPKSRAPNRGSHGCRSSCPLRAKARPETGRFAGSSHGGADVGQLGRAQKSSSNGNGSATDHRKPTLAASALSRIASAMRRARASP